MSKGRRRNRRWQGTEDGAGRRPSVYLGPLTDAEYSEICGHLRNLQRSRSLGVQITPATAAWLASIDGGLREKLAAARLCEAGPGRRGADQTIAGYVAAYIERRSDLGERTIKNLRQTERKLVEHFGKTRRLGSVTVGDAKGFRQAMEAEGYEPATVSMFIKKARQFFADAVDRELLAKNPFRGVKAGQQVNAARMRYVPAETVEAVMRHAPGDEWRLILALARYAGLRCPSELVPLTWGDVDLAGGKLHVHSSKTRKQGKSERFVPVHARLGELLAPLRKRAADLGQRMFSRVDGSSNLRTQIERMCAAAGVQAWPKALQNLRLSCETDWMDSDSVALACKWSGNTPDVALRHYHLVRDSDYQRVRMRGAGSGAEWCRTEGNQSEAAESTSAASGAGSPGCTPVPLAALAAGAALAGR